MISSAVLVCCLLTAPPIRTPARAEHFIEAEGVRIRYVECGTGAPVVLVHGFWDSIDITWEQTGVLDRLSQNYRVLAIDCRGHGQSDKPHEPAAYGTQMVHDVARVLDELDIERAHVVGHSMGAHISIRFASTYPHRVRSVTLIGAGAAPPDDDPMFMVRLADSIDRGEGMKPLIEHIWPESEPAPTPEQINAVNAEAFKTNDPEALSAVARGYDGLTTTPSELKSLTMPILAIVGTEDAMESDVRRLAARNGSVRTVTIKDAGHMDILNRPELLAAIFDLFDQN